MTDGCNVRCYPAVSHSWAIRRDPGGPNALDDADRETFKEVELCWATAYCSCFSAKFSTRLACEY